MIRWENVACVLFQYFVVMLLAELVFGLGGYNVETTTASCLNKKHPS
jgi:hypothetical protein